MRLWSIHPKYLDAKGLVAAWREALLSKKFLEGKTIGYKNHPQLIRFKNNSKTLLLINLFLLEIYNESKIRGYNFDITKINISTDKNFEIINVTNLQIKYEFELLKEKLKIRDYSKYLQIKNEINIEVSNIFHVINGNIENWEKVKPLEYML